MSVRPQGVLNTHRARTLYCVRPTQLSKILSHREKGGITQFLVLWTSHTRDQSASDSEAVCSWHPVQELTACLNHVQEYVVGNSEYYTSSVTGTSPSVDHPDTSRKRKAPGAEPISRDHASGLLTPQHSLLSQPSSRETSLDATVDSTEHDIEVYNGVLQRKEGWLVAKQLPSRSQAWQSFQQMKKTTYASIDVNTLPSVHMKRLAASTKITEDVAIAIREAFLEKLAAVPLLYLENRVDVETPPLTFKFIKDYVLRDGVIRADPDSVEGCTRPCRPNMGQNIGCEYSRECICLEYAAVDESSLQAREPEKFEEYKLQKKQRKFVDTIGLPKRFPYQKASGNAPARLQPFYREQRHPIYECNPNCNCGPACKSRLVQKGRKVPLIIFKTAGRGWGLKCGEDLVQGEFIDTYCGEVITNGEADRREAASKDKSSYLYSLDKFVRREEEATVEEPTKDTCHVVDGQYMGGPTRFMNHSCEPNVRQYTASYNKHDLWVYDLAFFALQDIPAGTELTFDYMDRDEEEEEDIQKTRTAAAANPENAEMIPCNCGARKCRGYLW